MKHCKDCKHYERHEDAHKDVCTHEQSAYPNDVFMIRGEGIIGRYLCSSMRLGICGMDGDLFEPRDAA